jgi:hypothetical protein
VALKAMVVGRRGSWAAVSPASWLALNRANCSALRPLIAVTEIAATWALVSLANSEGGAAAIAAPLSAAILVGVRLDRTEGSEPTTAITILHRTRSVRASPSRMARPMAPPTFRTANL